MFTLFSIIWSMLMLYLQYIEKILEKLLKNYKKLYYNELYACKKFLL